MRYHSSTFQLLGREPVFDEDAAEEIATVEARLGRRLPASVREWYSLKEAIPTLYEHSNEDPPIPVRDFKIAIWGSEVLLPVRYENQGVCTWAVQLDGSDDPPVFVESGPNAWVEHSHSFSDYVYCCVWDYRTVLHRPAIVQAQNSALTPQALRMLKTRFTPELTTHGWPGQDQYRFCGEDGAVLIWSEFKQAAWFAAASDAASLQSLLESVWDIDAVGDAFYDCSAIGRVALDTMPPCLNI